MAAFCSFLMVVLLRSEWKCFDLPVVEEWRRMIFKHQLLGKKCKKGYLCYEVNGLGFFASVA